MEINNIAQYQFNPMINNYTSESAVKTAEINNNVYPGGASSISRMKKSTSYVIKVSSGTDVRHFLLLPVAIHEKNMIQGLLKLFQPTNTTRYLKTS